MMHLIAWRTSGPATLTAALTVLLVCPGPLADGQDTLEAPFTRMNTGRIATDTEQSNCAAWGDYDHDGWLDLFVGNNNFNERNALYHNNQDGSFTRVTTGPLGSAPAEGVHAAAWADYDNDGWLDIVLATLSSVPNQLYRNQVGTHFTLATISQAGSLAVDAANSVGTSWADFDRDGNLDLFIPNGALFARQQDMLFRNDGGGRFNRVTDSPVTDAALSSTHGAWADYDNDGDPDLFVTHSQDLGNALFRNDGSGGFTDVAEAVGVATPGDSVGASWGDYDNDGDLDLFVANLRLSQPNTRNFLFRNRGDGTFERVTDGVLVSDTGHFVSSAWVDYDNDGWLDLFVTVDAPNNGRGNRLFRNQGDGTFVSATSGSLVTDRGNSGGCAWGDYDNDGYLDVAVVRGTIYNPQRNGLYRNNGGTNAWLKLRCIGTASNRSAIGTRIRVKATIRGQEMWQLRQIVGTEGWLSFHALDVVVGLGDATFADVVRIEWPSGHIQELHDVQSRTTLTVVEGVTSNDSREFVVTSAADSGPGTLRQAILDANATSATDTIGFDLPGTGPQVILLGTELPAIAAPVILDATTQRGYAGSPRITIDSSTATPRPRQGLRIAAGPTTVRGLAFIGSSLVTQTEFGADIELFRCGTNVIEGCYLGVTAEGKLASANGISRVGIRLLNSSYNRIGGVSPATRNIIAGHAESAVLVSGQSRSNTIQGNFVGILPDGSPAWPQPGLGIVLNSSENLVGGLIPAAANVIFAPAGGIVLNATQTTIAGNRIGTDPSGTSVSPVPDPALIRGPGILLENHSHSNLISGNVVAGVGGVGASSGRPARGAIQMENSSRNRIVGNHVGSSAGGTNLLGNFGPGFLILGLSEENTIGGSTPSEANVIIGNSLAGVLIAPFGNDVPRSNRIQGNRIAANQGLGIDLVAAASGGGAVDGVTPGDVGDTDSGANDLQNAPVLVSAGVGRSGIDVRGSLSSRPRTTYVVEFYHQPACDESGYGEGRDLIGKTTVTTDPSGTAELRSTMLYNAAPGSALTATATDPGGNTSEFSACTMVTLGEEDSTVRIPFRAFFSVTNLIFPNPAVPGRLEVRVGGSGPVSDLGTCSIQTTNQFTDLATGRALADYTLTTQDGDQATMVLEAMAHPDLSNPARITFSGSGHITGGTGRLAGLTGTVSNVGWSELSRRETGEGVGYLELRGSIPFAFARLMVSNTEDDGPGSLRQAILDANASPGIDTVLFNIPGLLPHVIEPRIPLPAASEPLQIDATSQPGYVDRPVVELRGLETVSGGLDLTAGLTLAGGRSWIRGLAIYGFVIQLQLTGQRPTFAGSNLMHGCYIGLDSQGGRVASSDPWKNLTGVRTTLSSGNELGGPGPSEGNVVSGLGYVGIEIQGARDTSIRGNRIGTDPSGQSPVPNGSGIYVAPEYSPYTPSVGTLIGGAAPSEGNLISGNSFAGIAVTDSRLGRIRGNRIGLDASGTQPLPNKIHGIQLAPGCEGTFTVVSNVVSQNVISGNDGNGTEITDCARRNVVAGNWIGTDTSGTRSNLGNRGHGIVLAAGATDNVIGGTEPADANIIAYNGGSGVFAGSVGLISSTPSQRSRIRGNILHHNGGLGIDIDTDPAKPVGVSPNDAGDADSGPNGRQNFPVMTRAEAAGNELIVHASLASRPTQTYTLDFYASLECDPLGHGEGQIWLGSAVIATDAGGSADTVVVLSQSVPVGFQITATATDASGNTSEFSECMPVLPGHPRPPLAIERRTGGSVALTWPADGTIHVLEATSSLAPSDWQPVPGVVGNRLEVAPGESRYYRLRRP